MSKELLKLVGKERYIVKYKDSNGNRFRVEAITKPIERSIMGHGTIIFRDAQAPANVDSFHIVDCTLVLCISVQQQDAKYGGWHTVGVVKLDFA